MMTDASKNITVNVGEQQSNTNSKNSVLLGIINTCHLLQKQRQDYLLIISTKVVKFDVCKLSKMPGGNGCSR